MLNIGPQELLLILVIALVVVGPHRLPELARSIGKGLREIRKAQDEVKRTIKVELDEVPGSGGSERVAGPDPTPLASEPRPPSEVTEISRTLGRSLGELRRAKEEVRRSFRVDLDDAVPPRAKAKTTPRPAPAEPPATAAADDTPPEP